LAIQVKTLKYDYTIWGTHHALYMRKKPAFGPAFAILSLETYVAHQNYNDFFCQKVEKNGSFCQFHLSLQSWHNLFSIGLDKGKQKGKRVHFLNIFSTLVAVPHFINGPFEIPERLAVEKKNS